MLNKHCLEKPPNPPSSPLPPNNTQNGSNFQPLRTKRVHLPCISGGFPWKKLLSSRGSRACLIAQLRKSASSITWSMVEAPHINSNLQLVSSPFSLSLFEQHRLFEGFVYGRKVHHGGMEVEHANLPSIRNNTQNGPNIQILRTPKRIHVPSFPQKRPPLIRGSSTCPIP